jgi:ATPase subunit of ABC transporter with duplicated ATPase domains
MALQWLHVSKFDGERVSAAKKTRQSVFPGGHGVELTAAPFMDAAQARSDAKATEAAAKTLRDKDLATARELKAAQEAAWKQETDTVSAAADRWTSAYGEMSKAFLKSLDAPEKSKRRLKKLIFEEAAALLLARPDGVAIGALENVSLDENFTSELEDVRSDGEESEYSPYAEG